MFAWIMQSEKFNSVDMIVNCFAVMIRIVRQRDLFTWNYVVEDNKIALY